MQIDFFPIGETIVHAALVCAIPDFGEHSGGRRRVLGSHMCSLLRHLCCQHHEVNLNSNEGLLLLSSVLRLIGDGSLVGGATGLCGIHQKSSFFFNYSMFIWQPLLERREIQITKWVYQGAQGHYSILLSSRIYPGWN